MKPALILLLIAAAAAAVQTNNGCCGSYSNCCTACNYEQNCCNNCCKQTDCQQQPNSCNENCSITIPGTFPTPATCSPTDKTCSTGSSSSGAVDVSGNSDSSQIVQTDIKLNNGILNTNKVYVPIEITNTNINTIDVDEKTMQSTAEITKERTETVRSSYIPYPVLIPVPYPYPVHYPMPQQQGCCTVVNPCVQQNCVPYQQTCGQQCTNRIMYNPSNPCPDQGCIRRDYWTRGVCQPSGNYPYVNCGYVQQDCSPCTPNFYQDYSSYQRCRGCFS